MPRSRNQQASPKRRGRPSVKATQDANGSSSVKEGDWKRLIGSLASYAPREWIRTGIPSFDLMVGEGIPRGRPIEVVGKPQAGKTALVLTIGAAFQRSGGEAYFYDLERKLEKSYAEKNGVDWKRFHYDGDTRNLEDFGRSLARIANSAPSKTPVVVIADGIASLPGMNELIDILSPDGISPTDGLKRAKGLTQAIRASLYELEKRNVTVIFVNQLRVKVNRYGAAGEDSQGGAHLKYSMSLRLMCRADKPVCLPGRRDIIIGRLFAIEAVKNTFVPPHRSCILKFRFDSGFDPFFGFKDFLVRYGRCAERRGALIYKGRSFKVEELPSIVSEMPELLAPMTLTHEKPEGAEVEEKDETAVAEESSE